MQSISKNQYHLPEMYKVGNNNSYKTPLQWPQSIRRNQKQKGKLTRSPQVNYLQHHSYEKMKIYLT